MLLGQLTCRLREQGWPDYLVYWVYSFATQRSVKLRLDSETGPETAIQCSLPQGSPILSILFILYIAPLFWLGVPIRRFGYTDNITLLAISKSLQNNYNSLQADAQEALN